MNRIVNTCKNPWITYFFNSFTSKIINSSYRVSDMILMYCSLFECVFVLNEKMIINLLWLYISNILIKVYIYITNKYLSKDYKSSLSIHYGII